MNYFTEINTRLENACKNSAVATSANISAANWGIHVFSGGRKFIGGQNRGRVPFIVIYRNNSVYNFDAVGENSDQGGELISSWTIEIVAGKNLFSDEKTDEEFAYGIAQAALKQIKSEYNLAISNERIGEIENHPFGISLKIEININNTHSKSTL